MASQAASERWVYETGGVSAIAAHDGTYVVAAGGTLQAFDATSGDLVWTASGGDGVPDGAFVVHEASGTLVAGTSDGTAVGLAVADGTERWRRAMGGGAVGIALDDDVAYLLASDSVAAVDAASGSLAWSTDVNEARGITTVGGDVDAAFAYHTDSHIYGLDGSGTELWSVNPYARGYSTDETFLPWQRNAIAAVDQYVYYLGDEGNHGVVDADLGEFLWQRRDDYTDLENGTGGPVSFSDAVVSSGANASIVDLPGGDRRWGSGLASYDCLAATERAVYVGGNAGGTATLRSFSPGGSINWTVEFGEFADLDMEAHPFGTIEPAVTDGSLAAFVRPEGGPTGLYCFELPEAEWVGEPEREAATTASASDGSGTDGGDDGASTATVDGSDGGDSGGGDTSEASSTDDGGDASDPARGFFSNGDDQVLSSLSGSGLTLASTGITVLGIAITLLDMIRGGDD
jgi:hypothetical protein